MILDKNSNPIIENEFEKISEKVIGMSEVNISPSDEQRYGYIAEPPRKPKNEISFMDFSSLENALKTAEVLCKARCIPKEFWDNPADILVAVQFGHDIGISPMTAIQNVMIINNRPAIWGDLMLAVCMRSRFQKGGFIDCIETYDEDTQTAYCTVTRDGRDPVTRKFSIDDAKNANLLGKPGSWQTHRPVMQGHRARTRCLKDMFPDLLKGVSGIEEMRDIIEGSFERKPNNLELQSTPNSMKERLKEKLTPINPEVKND
jgi:hypothetical protein